MKMTLVAALAALMVTGGSAAFAEDAADTSAVTLNRDYENFEGERDVSFPTNEEMFGSPEGN